MSQSAAETAIVINLQPPPREKREFRVMVSHIGGLGCRFHRSFRREVTIEHDSVHDLMTMALEAEYGYDTMDEDVMWNRDLVWFVGGKERSWLRRCRHCSFVVDSLIRYFYLRFLLRSNIQGVCGSLDGAVTPPDDQDMIKLVIGIDNLGHQSNIHGVCGSLDGAVTPSDDQDTAKLVKLVQIGPSGELDGTPTLPDGQDTTKTVETYLVCTQNL
ncbi:hypothetical protein Tco_0724666 [Tanacetum coccineum]